MLALKGEDNSTKYKFTWGLALDTTRPAPRAGLPGNPQASPAAASQGLDLSGTIHGAGGIGGLLSCVSTTGADAGTYWYFYDANGNVGQILTIEGMQSPNPPYIYRIAQYEYDPYGNTLFSDDHYYDISGNPVGGTCPFGHDNPFRFSTKWFDDETGLYYYGYRYYSPRLGRWTSRDPMEERGGWNVYSFASNSAIDRVDPHGLVGIFPGPIGPIMPPQGPSPAVATVEVWCAHAGSSGGKSTVPGGVHCAVKCTEPGGRSVFCEGTGPNAGPAGPNGNGHPGCQCQVMPNDWLSNADSGWVKTSSLSVPAGSCSCIQDKCAALTDIPNKYYDMPGQSTCHSNSNAAISTVISCCNIGPIRPSGALGWGCAVKHSCCNVWWESASGNSGTYVSVCKAIGCSDLSGVRKRGGRPSD